MCFKNRFKLQNKYFQHKPKCIIYYQKIGANANKCSLKMQRWMTDLDNASYGTKNLNMLMGRRDIVRYGTKKLKHVDGSTRSNILDGLQIISYSILY